MKPIIIDHVPVHGAHSRNGAEIEEIKDWLNLLRTVRPNDERMIDAILDRLED